MNTAVRTTRSLRTGLLVLLATLTLSFTTVSAGTISGSSSLPYIVTQHEINTLLSHYFIDNRIEIHNITIKIYGANDELVYSAKVCQNVYECDERLNLLINQSDFITEVDDTKIYILNQ